MSPRTQCAKCPWKVGVDPFDIPGGYSAEKHCALESTIREGWRSFNSDSLRLMACHETAPGAEMPCAGWLAHQLGHGNNLALRLAALRGQIDARFELDGPQHATFEATLPRVP